MHGDGAAKLREEIKNNEVSSTGPLQGSPPSNMEQSVSLMGKSQMFRETRLVTGGEFVVCLLYDRSRRYRIIIQEGWLYAVHGNNLCSTVQIEGHRF